MTEHRTSSNSGRGGSRAPRRRAERPELLELRQEVRDLRRGDGRAPRDPRRSAADRIERSPRRPRSARARRSRRLRRRLLILAALALVALVLIVKGTATPTHSFALPNRASLARMSVGQRIVAIADSQLGYSTDPSQSYCNKFSAYWGVGSRSCPNGEKSEEWCADFAAWAWRKAGVPFSYGFGAAEIDAAAASFYAWGVDHGTWHSAYGNYRPRPGDVAVYGLSLGTSASAAHVAIVTGTPSGQRGPNVVNGDGDRTAFSVVETGTDQLRADTGDGQGAPLAGYVSPG